MRNVDRVSLLHLSLDGLRDPVCDIRHEDPVHRLAGTPYPRYREPTATAQEAHYILHLVLYILIHLDLGLFLYLTLSYFFAYDFWLIILQNLILLPQIVRNARIGNNPGFSSFYIFGYLGTRFMIPFYERGCPANHFLLSPDPVLVSLIAVMYFTQVIGHPLRSLSYSCSSN